MQTDIFGLDLSRDAAIAETLAEFERRGASLSRTQERVVQLGSPLDIFTKEAPDGPEAAEFDDGDFGKPDDRVHLTVSAYLDKIPQAWKDEWAGVEINRSDWRPPLGKADVIDDAFRDFVLSPIPRFDQLSPYLQFYLYVEQARRWNEETKDVEITDLTPDEALVYAQRELKRMTINSWYALLRYVRIREDTNPLGRKYGKSAGCPQAYLCFIIDRGNSLILLKGRQAAITSTVMAVLSIMMLMNNNWTGVLLTDDKTKTGEDLFDKKVLSTLKLLPEWISQDFVWDRQAKDNVTLDFREDNTKASRRRNFSDLMLLSSDDTQAVNSKTPTITAYDEAQNIATFAKIVGEVKSTQTAEVDGVRLLIRQQLAWGTGTSNPIGKGVFLREWRSIYKAFRDGHYTGGWIPLFFDWTCKPGMNLEQYMKDREEAMNKYRYENDRSALAIFASANPSHPDDAFMENHKQVIPAVIIKKFRDRLLGHDALRPIKGIFKPIYSPDPKDKTKSDGYADHPSKIIGSQFIPARTAYEMLQAPVQMFLPPYNNWIGRNYQGTDPIQSATGRSKFASAVIDAVGFYHPGGSICCGTEHPHFHPTVACILNGRTHDPKFMFTQSVLMGIHYRNHGQTACRELIEWNQGQNYIEYKQYDWIDQFKSLVGRLELPEGFQGKSGNPFGMQVDVAKKAKMLTVLEELVYNHGHNIRFLDFWEQLNEIELEEKDGKKTWGTRDDEQFNDDIVIAVLMAKICRDSFAHIRPVEFNTKEAPAVKYRMRPMQVATPLGMRVKWIQEAYEPRYA